MYNSQWQGVCHSHWYLYNHAIDYMSQYVHWTATPVSKWIYGNVWECEWKWWVGKVVVLYLSIIRLVHTQKWCPAWRQIHAPRARINTFSLRLSQWVCNLRNKVKRTSRRLIRIEESAILFDLSVDLFMSALISLQFVPRAFHSRFPRRYGTRCEILWRAFDL